MKPETDFQTTIASLDEESIEYDEFTSRNEKKTLKPQVEKNKFRV